MGGLLEFFVQSGRMISIVTNEHILVCLVVFILSNALCHLALMKER